ncbi:hypothetical protein [Phocicoccus pinnipedialis]|uniref:Uncharacterized protein n=1 Tax=Phocicoccus pinnipedialis TaxID=110845 RepID=A0A6V7RJI9_9BACL|nr:hypothetical protein [Jeotgalicoccus pinnipedialis]MBP1938966.1 hypothetical protein [Jeotgalicoccus pinnipedialis]CAD2077375.1 hypothetical protein JEOPIN946_01471 [Jeotgalicoccus pinnipedialis]
MPNNNHEPKELSKSEREALIELIERNEYVEAKRCFIKKVGCFASGKACSNKEKTQAVLEVSQIKAEIKMSRWLEIFELARSSFYEWKES